MATLYTYICDVGNERIQPKIDMGAALLGMVCL